MNKLSKYAFFLFVFFLEVINKILICWDFINLNKGWLIDLNLFPNFFF